jgi:hypothetical protein
MHVSGIRLQSRPFAILRFADIQPASGQTILCLAVPYECRGSVRHEEDALQLSQKSAHETHPVPVDFYFQGVIKD